MRGYALLSLCLWHAVGAVYQDEAGKTDIHFPLLGCPTDIFFHSPVEDQGSICYAASDRNVIAALSCRDGSILWRQSAWSGTTFLDAQPLGSQLLTVADDGSVTGWSATTGIANWITNLGHVQGNTQLSVSSDAKSVYVLGENQLTAIAASDGSIQWHAQIPDESVTSSVRVSSDASTVFVIATMSDSNGISVLHLDKSTGESKHTSTLATDKHFNVESFHVSKELSCATVVWKSSQQGDIQIKMLSTGSAAILKTGMPYDSFSVQSTCEAETAIVLVSFSGTDRSEWAEVYRIDLSSGTIVSSYHIPAVRVPTAYTLSQRDSTTYVVRTSAELQHGRIEVWSSEGHGRLATHDIVHTDFDGSSLKQISAEVIASAEGVMARVMVTSQSCGFYLWQDTSAQWSRPEGLTRVKKVLLVSLPERQGIELMSGSGNNLFVNFVSRVKRHAAALMSLLSPTGASTQESSILPQRDHFGFRQYAVCFSDSDVWAIDTLMPNTIVWHKSFEQAGLSFGNAWLQDTDAHEAFESVMIHLDMNKGTDSKRFQLNALTGSFSEGVATSSARLLPESYNHTVSMAITSNIAKATSRLEGTVLDWEFPAPPGNHFIAKATAAEGEMIASVGRVLGDRGVLYKYLGQSVALISVNEVAGTLTAFLLAAEDGRILHQATHFNAGTSKPVHVVVSENWFAYHFWVGGETNAYQIVITELYQGERNTRSANVQDEIHAITQSYIYDYELAAMVVTTSKQGITSRDIVVALKTGEITTISRRLLDPRRPTHEKLSAADKEEMLLPYSPVIAIEPKEVLSHGLAVLGVRDIIAGPTLLESTGIICAYGLDIFMTRVTPSMPFDILSESFSKAQIGLSLSVLLAAIIITKPIAARKTLTRRWIG